MARALVLSLIVLTACGGSEGTQPPNPIVVPPTNPITGLLTNLERDAGDTITALTLDVEGTSYRILVDPERDYGFDLAHMDEHLSQMLQVSVSFEERSGAVYATAIDDA